MEPDTLIEIDHVSFGYDASRTILNDVSLRFARGKVTAILAHGMTPIMCVGETLEQREAGETEAVVLGQVVAGLHKVKAEQVASMVIAYEPVWAIGTGRTATAEDAQSMCASIGAAVAASFGADAARAVRIQYGGSVKAGTTAELMAQPDVDGALVGGASLDPDEFAQIIRIAAGE